MKALLVSCLFTVSLAAAEPFAVTNLWLNDQVVVEIPIGMHRVTTLNFARPIQGLDGAGLTTDGRGEFQLAHSGASSSLALRALSSGATGNLNVRIDDKTYVFVLAESRTPMLAVNFLAASAILPTSGLIPTHLLAPEQLLGLLDRARNYHVLRQHHPTLVSDVSLAQPRSVMDFATFTIRLEEVLRFDKADALAFSVTLQSKTGQEVRYHAGSWAVRVGDRVYPQALADSSGVIPAQGQATVWFLVQGSPNGQRNLLSPRNPFLILVNPL